MDGDSSLVSNFLEEGCEDEAASAVEAGESLGDSVVRKGDGAANPRPALDLLNEGIERKSWGSLHLGGVPACSARMTLLSWFVTPFTLLSEVSTGNDLQLGSREVKMRMVDSGKSGN
jgi:hypothetical protein